jgi:hypothetical protein
MKSDLVSVYLATDYVVFDRRKSVAVRVGQRSRSVDALLARWQAKTGAFITAWNAFGRAESVGTNALRDRVLKRYLIGNGFACLSGEGRGRTGEWPPEPSLLAFGMSRAQAASIGRRFRQNAIVYVPLGMPAELITLRWLG